MYRMTGRPEGQNRFGKWAELDCQRCSEKKPPKDTAPWRLDKVWRDRVVELTTLHGGELSLNEFKDAWHGKYRDEAMAWFMPPGLGLSHAVKLCQLVDVKWVQRLGGLAVVLKGKWRPCPWSVARG